MIPVCALVDANVLIASADVTHHAHAPARAALEYLRERRSRVIISTMVWAELGRAPQHGGAKRIPSWVRIMSFSLPAARWLADQLPVDRMRAVASTGRLRETWSFDAMILASAVASGADALVTGDTDDYEALRKSAVDPGSIKIAIVKPEAVGVSPQQSLF